VDKVGFVNPQISEARCVSKHYMKNWTIILVGLILQSCFNCPEPVFIEFDNINNTIQVLNEDYYIKSLTITEYLNREGYIEKIDSSKIKIEQFGARGTNLIYIDKPVKNYTVSGQTNPEFMVKKLLQFQVVLEKFENKKDGRRTDTEFVDFVKGETKGKVKYNSTHPCP
jgi:hypothetical protein